MREAVYYTRLDTGQVQCRLCPHGCRLSEGQKGICRQRINRNGRLYVLNYGQVAALNLDPVEKKPLYHFYPGKNILSIGTVGCNLRCGFCQNWEIAHGDAPTREMTAEELVAVARHYVMQDNVGLAYTYNEPLMWYEFVLDTARRVREAGLKNVLVTNGHINLDPLVELLPYTDAWNIDVKAFTGVYYRKTCGGYLEPVLQTVEKVVAAGVHVEITTLLVPGLNDKEEEIEALARWLADLSADIPLHFARYFPRYNFDLQPTPLSTLLKAREIARRYLRYVYIGNAPEAGGSDTLCPACGTELIRRYGYLVEVLLEETNNCPCCGETVSVIR